MIRAIVYCIIGVLGWIQAIWLPLYVGFSATNVYAWAVCANCRAFLWVFATLDLCIGLLTIIIHAIGKAEVTDIDSVRGLTFVLVVSCIVLTASIF